MLPRGWDRRTTVVLTFALLSVIASIHARAQVFDFEKDRVPMADLNGLVRFHTGDDPDGKLGWADPNFDDSQWPLIRSDRDFSQQGYKDYSGMAWYRFRVVLPREHRPFGLYIRHLLTCYQIFAGGQLIGQFGQLPPHERAFRGGRYVYLLPAESNHSESLLIAIRVWHWPAWARYAGGGLWVSPRIGDADTLRDWGSKEQKELIWKFSAANYQILIEFLAGIGGIALFALRRKERGYLLFGVYELSGAAWIFLDNGINIFALPITSLDAAIVVMHITNSDAFITFIAELVGLSGRGRKLYWTGVASSLLQLPIWYIVWFNVHIPWLNLPAGNGLDVACDLVFGTCLLLILMFGASRGKQDAKLLFIPVSLSLLQDSLYGIGWTLVTAGFGSFQKVLDRWDGLVRWPFPIGGGDIANVLVDLSLFAILVLRFTRSRRDEERFKAELESARVVQQVLIPEEIPTIPGFEFDCVYKPAGEVGGDFFQILPTQNHGALIVIGDVSGKGMPAAMAVSLLVGTARTLAHYTQSPAEILTAMNQRMLGRSKDGFTTCLVLRIDANGTGALANAGHLAPYLDARELPVDNGLPLGISGESAYTESSFHLGAGQEVTLLTDGIAEARAKTGELFGF